jgi:ABC-type polysaccharide/polyol phosphate transport system ATPase subunit
MNTVFQLDNVRVSFNKHVITERSLKHLLGSLLEGQQTARHDALADVNLKIHEGEHVGVIGRNGAGKSTLLRVLARVIVPQQGAVYVNGYKHIVPLLELGIGFHSDLSGRENCLLSGMLMGYTRKEIAEKLGGIHAFSELGDFFDQPVKSYSSGMYARLAFALATDVEPDVLLVDEVFGVGDEFFMRKCVARMQRLMQKGNTTVFVSHNLDFLVSQCDRLIWLDRGRVVLDGPSADVAAAYRRSEGLGLAAGYGS